MPSNRIQGHIKEVAFSSASLPDLVRPHSSREDLLIRFEERFRIDDSVGVFEDGATPSSGSSVYDVWQKVQETLKPRMEEIGDSLRLKPMGWFQTEKDPFSKMHTTGVLFELQSSEQCWLLPGVFNSRAVDNSGFVGKFSNAVGIIASATSGRGIVLGAVFSQPAFNDVINTGLGDFFAMPPFVLSAVKAAVFQSALSRISSGANHISSSDLVITDWQPTEQSDLFDVEVHPIKRWRLLSGTQTEPYPFGGFRVGFSLSRQGDLELQATPHL